MNPDPTVRSCRSVHFDERTRSREAALDSWDNEGGASTTGTGAGQTRREEAPGSPPLTNTELVQLQIHVIALENLVIALLAHVNEPQLDLVCAMAHYILPRPGRTAHCMTIHAAAEMLSLVARAGQFRPALTAGCTGDSLQDARPPERVHAGALLANVAAR